jgi:dihydroneopterin aldolase
MDVIYLRDLRVDTTIGVFEWERRIRQSVRIDMEMSSDIRKPAASDNISDAIDYKAVAKRVIAFVSESKFHLVEALAEEVAKLLITEFGIEKLKLKVNKHGAIRGATDVGVVIERSKQDYA